MSRATPEHTLLNSTYEPKDSPDELVHWWSPFMEGGFLPYKVKVVSKKDHGQKHLLRFQLAGDDVPPAEKEKVHEVDLREPGRKVWPQLPSTAQLGKEGQYGFLMLGPSAGINAAYAESGGKWPIGDGTF